MFLRPSCCGHVIKEVVHAFSCEYIKLWMHLGSLESTQEARARGGGGCPLYGLYRYVPRNRVWSLEVLDP